MNSKVPELVGIYEACELLGGVSNQYVNQLVKEGKLTPCQQLKCGKIFLKSEVEDFHNRKKN